MNKLYLKNVYLDNYKTINKFSTEFKDGLNIIIGKNGSGKTNFFEFMNKILNFDINELDNFEANFELFKPEKADKLKISLKGNIKQTKNMFKKEQFFKAEKNGEIKEYKKNPLEIVKQLFISKKSSIYYNIFLKYNIPQNYEIVDKSYDIDDNIDVNDIFTLVDNKNTILKNSINIQPFFSKISKEILMSFLLTFKENIIKYTNIEDIKFNDNLSFYENNNKITVKNIFLEFKVNDKWIPFSSLSDGTKRMFYIISEISIKIQVNKVFGITNISDGMNECKIIFIEEPELGIHPHQLAKLMEFLKEESKNNQIIITTHSPQVLNYLDKDKLDNIFISKIKDGITYFDKLSEQQKEKAINYIENVGFLSDYWVHSDLEE